MYEVNIDFDYASKCWTENKIKIKNGCYEYKKTQCNAISKSGKRCKRMTKYHYCSCHNK